MKSKKKNTSKSCQMLPEGTLPQQSGKALIVPYSGEPVKRSANKRIHPRPAPPPLPKGGFIPDNDSSPSLEIE